MRLPLTRPDCELEPAKWALDLGRGVVRACHGQEDRLPLLGAASKIAAFAADLEMRRSAYFLCRGALAAKGARGHITAGSSSAEP